MFLHCHGLFPLSTLVLLGRKSQCASHTEEAEVISAPPTRGQSSYKIIWKQIYLLFPYHLALKLLIYIRMDPWYLFYTLDYNPILTSCSIAQIVSNFHHWELFYSPLYLWHTRILEGSFWFVILSFFFFFAQKQDVLCACCIFSAWVLESLLFLKETPSSTYWRMALESKIRGIS